MKNFRYELYQKIQNHVKDWFLVIYNFPNGAKKLDFKNIVPLDYLEYSYYFEINYGDSQPVWNRVLSSVISF